MPYNDTIISHRRNLHRIPEVGYQEFKTSAYIRNELEKLNSFELKAYAGTGIVAVYKKNNNPFLAFRSDIDALPLNEETELEYCSENKGFMHACGHDAHMGIMLTVAKLISDEKPDRNLILIFQPAEEGPAGGKKMVDEGLFKDFNIKEIFALHVAPDIMAGSIGVNYDKMFAGTVEFAIKLKGKGGHAAFPHLCDDLNIAGANLVLQINTITSRFLDPVKESVLTLGHIKGGQAANVIPEEFDIKGTARSFSIKDLNTIKNKISDMCKGIEAAFGIESELTIVSEYIPAINNKESAHKIFNLDIDDLSIEECKPKMTGEDFGYMLEETRGAIFWLGVGHRDKENYGLHNPKFNLNEDGLKYGFEIFKQLINTH